MIAPPTATAEVAGTILSRLRKTSGAFYIERCRMPFLLRIEYASIGRRSSFARVQRLSIMHDIREADWKLFRAIRQLALERFAMPHWPM